MSDLLTGLRTADWLDAQTFPPMSWVVPGVLPEGMSLMIGGPKIGKSWLSLDIALAVAAGGHVLGKVPVGSARPVLLLALEDGDRRLQDRCRELMGSRPLPRLLAYMTRIEPGTVVPTIEAWLATLDPGSDPLVIVDTLGKVMPPAAPGESVYQRDYRVAGRLKHIADAHPGMALLVLHHDRKMASDDFVDAVSGTNGIAGAADTILVIQRSRTEATGLFKVTGRDVQEREYQVTIEGGRWLLVGNTLDEACANAAAARATSDLSDQSAKIVRLVSEHPEGIRAADVAERLGMSADDAGRYLRRLNDSGRIEKPARGLYRPSVRSVRVSDSEDDETGQPDTTDRPIESLDDYLPRLPDRCRHGHARHLCAVCAPTQEKTA